ncbi:uncharacterized protein si:dkey-171c9.3 [Nothobranchius furzeri]|uniref:LOC107377001-like protein n=1 Tax=Nothobranchius furzeri TaxID=105023 RepID=A0A9D2Z226_NOTFU|nr:putative LOC107377001-like protein [Nothobranchius furzeri]
MQTEGSDPRLPGPIMEGLGETSSLNAEALGKFAQSMAENIINSMQNLEPEASHANANLDVLSEKLASTIMEGAFREVGSPPSAEDCLRDSTSACVKADQEEGRKETSRDAQSSHPPLSQSGLPVVGSLDYPDAPPTTPLIPELERSRHSFARKLKGGLAKVFLPSPPPPTPKDKNSHSGPQEELMENLMHSLSSIGLAADGLDAVQQQAANLESFAEDLSHDIMNWVWKEQSEKQITDERDLHLLAHQLAESIITSSIDKAKILI